MSGTRSPSPLAPATERQPRALLIAAHGDCGGGGANVLANELARRLRSLKVFDDVSVGFIHGAPSIEDAAAHIEAGEIEIFPLFMSDGYYVRNAIPRRLAIHDGIDALGHHVTIDTPLGLLPQLPQLLLQAAKEAALSAGMSPADATLLIAAHGSAKAPYSAAAARNAAARIDGAKLFARVETAFLEEEPYFQQVLETAPRPLVVLGFFAGGGAHAEDDVRGAVRALGDRAVVQVEQLGGYARIIELIVSEIAGGGRGST
jgi:sirohydrochlorin ferrochelatase